MTKTHLNPEGFLKGYGSYSHGVKVDVGDSELIFITGQIAVDSQNQVVSDNLTGQTEFIFQNIEKILQEGGASLDDIVKVTIYMTHLHPASFAEVAAVRNKYLVNAKPASTLVGILKTAKDACGVEIDVIAVHQKNNSAAEVSPSTI